MKFGISKINESNAKVAMNVEDVIFEQPEVEIVEKKKVSVFSMIKNAIAVPVIAIGITIFSLIGCGSNPMQPDYEARIVELEKENTSLRAVVGESGIPIDGYLVDLNERVETLENEKSKAENATVTPVEAVCSTDADCAAWEKANGQVEEATTTKPTTTVTIANPNNKPSAKAIALADEVININTASLADLMRLPGIGEKTAQAIIDARPFTVIEDILNVKGIGDKKYEGMKNNICIDCE